MRLRLGEVEHDLTTRPLVMGVLDPARPFLAGDGAVSLDDVLRRAEELVGEGADLLDVGGTGPAVGEEEELERVVPVIRSLQARVEVPLSVDTWRASVLGQACAAGAVIGNDVTGFVDPDYLPVAARAGSTVVITSTRLPAQASDPVAEVRALLGRLVATARATGMEDGRIVLDLGLGLGKTPAQSLALLRGSAALADLGPPLLLDASVARVLPDLDVEARRVAGHAAAALGIARGCRIVRTSDVRGARRVAAVLAALLAGRLDRVVSAGQG